MIEGPRGARRQELAAIVQLSNSVFCADGRGDMGRAFPLLFAEENRDNLRICLEDGKPVSLVGQTVRDLSLLGARVRVTCIGSVCTDDIHRGKGLASLLVEDALAVARSQGAVMTLVSGGRGLYRRMGCINAGLFQAVSVGAQAEPPRLACAVRAWKEEDVPILCALQCREPARFVRSEDETLRALRSDSVHARPGRTWVVTMGDAVVAWFSASLTDVLRVKEHAGSRLAVLSGLPRALRDTGLATAEITAPAADVELATMAAAYGLRTGPRGFDGTVKIIDAPALLRALAAEWPTLDVAGLERVPEQDLAALLFGSIEHTTGAPTLACPFPLPLPSYGLNYT